MAACRPGFPLSPTSTPPNLYLALVVPHAGSSQKTWSLNITGLDNPIVVDPTSYTITQDGVTLTPTSAVAWINWLSLAPPATPVPQHTKVSVTFASDFGAADLAIVNDQTYTLQT